MATGDRVLRCAWGSVRSLVHASVRMALAARDPFSRASRLDSLNVKGVVRLLPWSVRRRPAELYGPVNSQAPKSWAMPAKSSTGTRSATPAAHSGPPDGDIIHPDMLGLGRGLHIVVKPDFVDAQIRRGAPAHILLVQLLDAVDPHFLEAVGLADGVQFEMEDDLLPLAGDQCGLRRWLEKRVPVAAAHVGPIRVIREGLERRQGPLFRIQAGIEIIRAVRHDRRFPPGGVAIIDPVAR